MEKIEVGRRVRVKADTSDGKNLKGDMGMVVTTTPSFAGVEFDRDIGGHDCNGMGKDSHCWWMLWHEITLVRKATPHD